MSPKRVGNVFLFDEINLAAEHLFEFSPRLKGLPEIPPRVIRKGNEDIDIAIRPKIIAEDRTEEGQLAHLPPLAKLFDPLRWHLNLNGAHRPTPGNHWVVSSKQNYTIDASRQIVRRAAARISSEPLPLSQEILVEMQGQSLLGWCRGKCPRGTKVAVCQSFISQGTDMPGQHWRLLVIVGIVLMSSLALSAAEPAVTPLDPALRERCLAMLRVGLKSDEFWPAMHAAEALTLAGQGAEVLPALAVRSPLDDQQQCGLAREAVRTGERAKISVLLEILVKPGSNGHTHAAESLFKVAEVGDGSGLRAALRQSDDLKQKLMAAAALARNGHPTALDVVRGYMAHDDLEVRKSAVWILGQLGAARDVPPLQRAMAAADDPLLKAYCVHALACLGDEGAKKTLGENLRSPLPAVRTYAAEFAGYCRANEHRGELVRLLDDDTLDVRVRAAQSLIVLSLPANALGLPIAVAQKDIARDLYPATAANPRYSEGSIAVLKDNTLLYATTEFIGGGADHATARIIGRMSHDRGASWGALRVLQEDTGRQNVMSVTLRRLAPGRFDGPLGMFYLVKNSPTDLHVYLRISDDEAHSFGDPIRVTTAPGYHVMNNDRVTVTSGGRLICPIAWTDDVFKAGGGHFVSFCYLSDDGGRTWRRSAGEVDQPNRGAMEPDVVELAGGKLLMIVRTQVGRIATSFSTDGGDHWSSPAELSVQSPESPATIRRIPATGDLLLVWNNGYTAGVGHGGKRTPLTTAVSSDDGQTWRHLRNLEDSGDEGYAYTSVTFHRDRVLMSYYVADDKTGRISSRFRSLPVSWLYGAP
jgi:sialidase-1